MVFSWRGVEVGVLQAVPSWWCVPVVGFRHWLFPKNELVRGSRRSESPFKALSWIGRSRSELFAPSRLCLFASMQLLLIFLHDKQ